MTRSKQPKSTPEQNRSTLAIRESSAKFIIEERGKQETARLVIETALCIIVGVVFLGSFLLFILPEIPLFQSYSGISLSAVMAGLAISLYAFATRGYKPQAGFDKVKKQFWICKLNSKGHARIVTYFSKADVQGVFIKRPSSDNKDAALCARIKGKIIPITLIRGHLSDVEAAHRDLCQALHDVNIVLPVKPVLKAKPSTPRPIKQTGPVAA